MVRSGAPPKVLPIEIPAMSLDELNRLTGNFGAKALIGEGSYGRVFYAKLSNGQAAAIKKLDASQEPDSDFAAQVRFLISGHQFSAEAMLFWHLILLLFVTVHEAINCLKIQERAFC